jgi:hypothetical protein
LPDEAIEQLPDDVIEADGPSEADKRTPRVDSLIVRMRAVLARRLEAMETEPMESADKEMALLSTMARTLGKLEEMRRARKGVVRKKAAPSPEMVALRKTIAARIDELNRA